MTQHRSTSANLTRRSALAALVGLCGLGGYRWWTRSKAEGRWREQDEAQQVLDRQLEQRVTIELGETTLRNWLAEFSRQTGMPVELVETESLPKVDASGLSIAYLMDIRNDGPVRLDLADVPAHELLTALAQLHATEWDQQADGTIVFNAQADRLNRRLLCVTLPSDLSPEGMASLGRMLPDCIEMEDIHRYSEYHVSGRGYVEDVPGAALIVQGAQARMQAKQLAARFASAYRAARDLPARGLQADDPALAPMWLTLEPSCAPRVFAALSQPITLKVQGVTWTAFADQLSAQLGSPIIVHPNLLVESTVTCDWRDCYLEDELTTLAEGHRLVLAPIAGGRGLVIVDELYFTLTHPVAAFAVPDFGLPASVLPFDHPLGEIIGCSISADYGRGPHDLLGAFPIIADGKLGITQFSLRQHARVRGILTAIRQVRDGVCREMSAYEPPTLSAESQAQLQKVQALEYLQLPVHKILDELAQLTGLKFILEPEGRYSASDVDLQEVVTCYLPPRPLEANLRRLLYSCGQQMVEWRRGLRLVHWAVTNAAHEADACTVFDLRSWKLKHYRRVGELFQSLEDLLKQQPYFIDDNDFRRLQELNGLLIVRAIPPVIERIREVLPLLEEHQSSGPVKRWRGEELTGERLNQPLLIWQANVAEQERNDALRAKLKQTINCEFQDLTRAKILLAIASEHEMPFVIHAPYAKIYPLDEKISYVAHDKSLADVLQDLLGDKDKAQWTLSRESLLPVERDLFADDRPPCLFSVDDLVGPRGPFQPDELIRVLEGPYQTPGAGGREVVCEMLIGNLLLLSNHRVSPAMLGDQLRQLRSQPTTKSS